VFVTKEDRQHRNRNVLLPTDVTKNIQALGFYKVSMGIIATMSRHQVSNLTSFAKIATKIHEVDEIPKDEFHIWYYHIIKIYVNMN
jgi:hypothetical protein